MGAVWISLSNVRINMARYQTTTSDAQTIKLFERTLIPEVLKETQFGQFVGSIISVKNELGAGKGDKVTYQLGLNSTGVGITEGESVDSNESIWTEYTDSLVVNELYEAYLVDGPDTIGQKRRGYDLRKEAYLRLKNWHKASLDIAFFNQLAGNTATTISGSAVDGRSYSGTHLTKALGFNTATAPSTNRVIRAGNAASDSALTSSDTFSLGLIDAAVEKAATATPYIAPITVNGEERYICFISPEQMVDLKRDTSTAVQWLDLATARLQGGDIKDNPLITGAAGVYNRTLIIESTRVPTGVSPGNAAVANTRRAIFCGKDALAAAFSAGSSPSGGAEPQAKFVETKKDADRLLQVTAGMIFGMKKTVFDSEDYATIVLSTYAATHTS